MAHLSTLAAPKSWPIKRKGVKWIAKPTPGPHNLQSSIPLIILLRNILKLTKTKRETKKLLNTGAVIINKKIRKEPNFPVGIMDIIEFPKTNQCLMLKLNEKEKFTLVQIKKEDAQYKLYKIINKISLKNKKIQLNLIDGTNLLVEKGDYKTGDTIVYNLLTKKIEKRLGLEKGALIYLISGKHTGVIGTLEEIKKAKDNQPDKIVFKTDAKKFETLKKYAFVINKPI